MSPTYGTHQEEAAHHLNRLLQSDVIPAAAAEVSQLLQVREAAMAALRDRLYQMGVGQRFAVPEVAVATGKLRLSDVPGNAPNLLADLAAGMPRMPIEQRASPVEVLGAPSANPTLEHWRHVAIELAAGTHALDSDRDQPWLREEGGGWYLLRDTAVTLEALLVLDDRMNEVGLLNDHDRPDRQMPLAERRMVTSQCARVAGWYGTSSSPDLAVSPVRTDEPHTLGPVRLVKQPADLIPAQRRLAGYLRPMHANAFSDPNPAMDAATARRFVTNQISLCDQLAREYSGRHSIAELRTEFLTRRDYLADVNEHMRHLIDVRQVRANGAAMWQQTEISAAMRRFAAKGTQLNPNQLLELVTATHEAHQGFAAAFRRETRRDDSNIRRDDPTGEVGPTRVLRRGPLDKRVNALINLPPPETPAARWVTPHQRLALRATIDDTPTLPRAHAQRPSPYPRGRGRNVSR